MAPKNMTSFPALALLVKMYHKFSYFLDTAPKYRCFPVGHFTRKHWYREKVGWEKKIHITNKVFTDYASFSIQAIAITYHNLIFKFSHNRQVQRLKVGFQIQNGIIVVILCLTQFLLNIYMELKSKEKE